MRVLLDEMLPVGVSGLLPGHEVTTVQQNITVSGIAVVLVRGSRLSELTPQADRIQNAVAESRTGTVTRVQLP